MPIGLDAVLNDKNFQDGLRRYENGLNQMEKSTDHTANVLTRIGSVMQGAVVAGLGAMTVAIGAMTAAASKGFSELSQWGESLDKLGDQFGLSGEEAAKWAAAFQHVGLSVEEGAIGLNTFTRGLADLKSAGTNLAAAKTPQQIEKLKEQLTDANTQLQRAQLRMSQAKKPTAEMGFAVDDAKKKIARLNSEIAAGNKLVPKAGKEDNDFTKALKALGVSAFSTKGKLKTFDEIMPEIMEAFQKLPAGVKASDLAMKLFGARGGSKFLDFLRQGKTGLENATNLVQEFGLELDTDTVNSVEEFGFAMNDLNLEIKGLWTQIGVHVLPVFHRFINFVLNRIMPVLNDFVRKYAPAFGRALGLAFNALDTLTTGLAGNWRPFAELMDKTFGRETANNIGNLINAFFGVRDAIVGIVQAFQSGGLSGGLQSIGDALATAVKNVDWTKVQAQLNTWKDQFWNWLIGKGGALDQAGMQLGKIITAISEWARTNTPDWLKMLETWKTDFWNWITDKDKGLLVTVADNMKKLAATIEAWATLPETKDKMQSIGKQVATDILNGLGRLFDDSGGKENLFIRLYWSLWQAEQSLRASWNSLGGALGSGIADGIREYFGRADVAESIRASLYNALATAISVLIPQIKRDFDLFKMVTGGNTPATQPATTPPTPQPAPATNTQLNFTGGRTTPGFARGGWVPFDMQAMIHAGEYVLNRQQARAFAPMLAGANNSRTYNFNNTWNGNANAIDRGELARIAEDSAYRGIQRAMRGT